MTGEFKKEPYTCPTCGLKFYRQKGPVMESCAVLHYEGECCHYAEKQFDLAEGITKE